MKGQTAPPLNCRLFGESRAPSSPWTIVLHSTSKRVHQDLNLERRFWRPLFCQLNYRPCTGIVYASVHTDNPVHRHISCILQVMEENAQTPLSVFFVNVDRIDPNPFQPRKEFSDDKLKDLSQSIRRYGVLQPLVVTKKEAMGGDGAMSARYELIAGERRLRASKIAGLLQVPVVIRSDIQDNNIRLELAIIENLQREDLNPIDRARAFKRLIDEFTMTHTEVAHRMSRSREYISNSLRLLTLPEDMVQAVVDGKISEGHTRPLLMLVDDPERQRALFNEMVHRKITVRESEIIARRHAVNRVRRHTTDPYVREAQLMIEGLLDTRVMIQSQGDSGGKIVIDYFSDDDLKGIIDRLREKKDVDTPDTPAADEKENTAYPESDNDDTEDDVYTFKNFSL